MLVPSSVPASAYAVLTETHPLWIPLGDKETEYIGTVASSWHFDFLGHLALIKSSLPTLVLVDSITLELASPFRTDYTTHSMHSCCPTIASLAAPVSVPLGMSDLI